MSQLLPLGTVVTFRQRLWFDSYRFSFDGSTSATGEIRIHRVNTDEYWDGSSWVDAETWVGTDVDTDAEEHTYDFDTTNLTGADLEVTMRVNEDPATHSKEKAFRVDKVQTGASLSFGGD